MSPFDSSRWIALADSLLPRWVTQEADELTRSRARGFVATVFGAGLFAIASSFYHGVTGNGTRGLFILLCTPLAALTLWLPHLAGRRGAAPESSLRPALSALLAVALVATSVAPLLSNEPFQVPVAISVVPLLAATLGGWRFGMGWTGLTLALLGAMSVAVSGDAARGLIAWNAFVAAGVIGVLGCVVEAAREKARHDAEAAAREASGFARSRDEKAAELRVSRELLAHAFRRMPALLVLSDLTTGQISDVNECFERLTGWSAATTRRAGGLSRS